MSYYLAANDNIRTLQFSLIFESMENKKSSFISSYLGYIVVACVFLLIRYVVELEFFDTIARYRPFVQKLMLSLAIVTIILFIGRFVENIIHQRSTSEGDRHNLQSIARLITSVLILIVIIAFLFQNLYAIAVSFGLISLVLGFALQAPIASFIAWLYIVFRRPYKIGDRIQLNGFRGDVVEVNYLDTAILECAGDYLQHDRRSGRIVYFPNSLILKSELINYSGPMIPFIYDETAMQIAYTSDLKYVEDCLLEAAAMDFKEHYPELTESADKWQAAVHFRVNTYAWLEAVIAYPVEPMNTTIKRNRILKSALTLLNRVPERVQFPVGSRR